MLYKSERKHVAICNKNLDLARWQALNLVEILFWYFSFRVTGVKGGQTDKQTNNFSALYKDMAINVIASQIIQVSIQLDVRIWVS